MAMTDKEVGKRLLGEVEECGLLEVLQCLWSPPPPPPPQDQQRDRLLFGIDNLDRVVNLFLQNSRHQTSQQPVLEIVSNAAAAGKTQLLYLLVANALCPPVSSTGKQEESGAILILDTDNRFDVEELAAVVTARFLTLTPAAARPQPPKADGEVPQQVKHALRHVHILRPQSLESLIATLKGLPEYLLDPTQHFSTHRHVALLAIDSITAFYWAERLYAEMATVHRETGDPRERFSPYADLVVAFKIIQSTFFCPIVATSWSFCHADEHLPCLRPLLPGIWNQFVTARVLVRREPVRKFVASLTLEQAMRDKTQRQEVVGRGRFQAQLDWWGSEGWPEAVKERLRRECRLRGFWFVISDGRVMVD